MKSLLQYILESSKAINWGDDNKLSIGDSLYYVDDKHKIQELEISDIFENPRYHQTIFDIENNDIEVVTISTDGIAKSHAYYDCAKGVFKIDGEEQEGYFFPSKGTAQKFINFKLYDRIDIKSLPDPKEYSK